MFGSCTLRRRRRPREETFLLVYLLALASCCCASAHSSYKLCDWTFNSSCVPQLCQGQGRTAEYCRKEENSSEPFFTLKDCYIDKNGTGCKEKYFQGAIGEHQLGTVKLKIFQAKPANPLQLNISFVGARWKQLKFRLQGSQKATCRSLLLSDKAVKVIPAVRDLYYDCSLLAEQNMDTDMILDYEANNGTLYEQGLFRFHVPQVPSIGTEVQEMLLYVEKIGTNFILHWAQTAECYQVEVFRNSNLVKSVLLASDGSETEVCPQPAAAEATQTDSRSYASFAYDSFDIPGNYKFRVEAKGKCSSSGGGDNGTAVSKTCSLSDSSVIIIVAESVSKVYLYVIVAVMAFLFFIFAGFFWVLFHLSHALSSKPQVLLLYSPTRPAHVEFVRTLALYLRNSCKVMALMDDLDIYASNERNPVNWYNWALLNVNCVFVISSPPQSSTKSRQNVGIFQHLDSIGIRYLEDRLADSSLIAVSVVLPYCSRLEDRGLPLVAQNLRNYQLLRDFDKILWSARGKYLVPRLLFQLFPHPGGGRTLKVKGAEVLQALKLAEADVKEDPPNPAVPSVAWRSALVPEPALPDFHEPSTTVTEVLHQFPPQIPKDLTVDEAGGFPGLLENLNLLGKDDDAETDDKEPAKGDGDDHDFLQDMNL